MKNLGELSNQELLAGVQATFGEERRWVARVIACLAEIDRRKLHLEAACSSLYDFCRLRLGMSDGEAFRRSTVAGLVQRFPVVLDALDRGDVHLSALVLLRKYLTDDNHEELLREASGKTKQGVAEMIATRFPKPDVPSRIVELPMTTPAQAALALGGATSERRLASAPLQASSRIEPLSSARYRIELAASRELRDKLQRVQDMMRHRNPSGDLEVILGAALDLLVAKLERDRLGKSTRRAKVVGESADDKTTTTAHRPGNIARNVRRAVYERDGEQCTFVDGEGRRCSSRAFLELDHVVSKARGGSDEADNLRVRCRAHNQLHAEQVFGRAHVEDRIAMRRKKRASTQRPVEQQAHLREEERIAIAPSMFEVAARGLRDLGFRESDIRRALAIVRAKLEPSASIQTILREAIAVAT